LRRRKERRALDLKRRRWPVVGEKDGWVKETRAAGPALDGEVLIPSLSCLGQPVKRHDLSYRLHMGLARADLVRTAVGGMAKHLANRKPKILLTLVLPRPRRGRAVVRPFGTEKLVVL